MKYSETQELKQMGAFRAHQVLCINKAAPSPVLGSFQTH